MKLSKDIPAVAQATALYHLKMRIAYDARMQGTSNHPCVSFFVSSIDKTLVETRRKVWVRS